ncbi:MAG: aminotransferase class III-fold pyridoxal phosphate-dependent enzyme [Chthonomonadales bacterium]
MPLKTQPSPSTFPGPIGKSFIDEIQKYVLADPFPFTLDLAAGSGMWLQTVDGQRLFDWAGYYASKLIGHNHPGLYEPDYVKRLTVAANNKVANPDFLTPECVAYYREIYNSAPVCMRSEDLEVYCVNSGAEAVENMMKYFINLDLQKRLGSGKDKGRSKFIYFDQAFHGRTVFALSVTQLDHDPVITRDYHTFDHGNIQIPFPAIDNDKSVEENRSRCAESLRIVETILKLQSDEVVAIILEPLQGAGGHRVALTEFYQGLSRLAHEHNVYFGFDEVQTVGGQTGKFFACDIFDLPYPPQAVAGAKKLGCGVVYMLYPMEDHGVLDSTWGGTLADMVRFVHEMTIVREERLLEQVDEKASHLIGTLKRLQSKYLDKMFNVRGLGLYQGFSLASAEMKSAFQKHARDVEGLLLLGAGPDTIRLRPNLNVTIEDIDLLRDMLDRCFNAV